MCNSIASTVSADGLAPLGAGTSAGVIMAQFVSHMNSESIDSFPLDKMADISQTMFSDAFSWIKSSVFWLKIHKILLLSSQLTNPIIGLDNGRIGDKPLSEPMLTLFGDAYIWH